MSFSENTHQKQYIPGLGTTADDQRRLHIRLDNDHRQQNVEVARKFIFEKGLGIKSKGVEGLLESKSSGAGLYIDSVTMLPV